MDPTNTKPHQDVGIRVLTPSTPLAVIFSRPFTIHLSVPTPMKDSMSATLTNARPVRALTSLLSEVALARVISLDVGLMKFVKMDNAFHRLQLT